MVRLSVVISLLLYLVYAMVPEYKVDTLQAGECMRDQTFIWTDRVNKFFRDNLETKNKSIIAASFLMDLMQLLSLTYFIMRI